jgi:hypothetical protein
VLGSRLSRRKSQGALSSIKTLCKATRTVEEQALERETYYTLLKEDKL